MNRRLLIPFAVYVITKLFYTLRNLMCSDRLMFAAADFYSGRSENASIRANSFKSETLQMQYGGDSQPKRALRTQVVFDHLYDCVKLTKTVSYFPRSPLVRIRDKLNIKSAAMPRNITQQLCPCSHESRFQLLDPPCPK